MFQYQYGDYVVLALGTRHTGCSAVVLLSNGIGTTGGDVRYRAVFMGIDRLMFGNVYASELMGEPVGRDENTAWWYAECLRQENARLASWRRF